MTDEILNKARELKQEIIDVESVAYYLNRYIFHLEVVDKKKAKIIAKNFGFSYEIRFPRELQEEILHTVNRYLYAKQEEYERLGCEDKQNERD